MPYIFPFEKLDVYRMALDLADFVLGLLESIPLNRHFRLVSQMEAAVVSVAQNIAEGKGRQYKKEFLQYLSIAQGSLYETITLNEVFRRRKLFTEEESTEIIVNDLNKLTSTICHCERSEAISGDCRVALLLAMTTFQGRSL